MLYALARCYAGSDLTTGLDRNTGLRLAKRSRLPAGKSPGVVGFRDVGRMGPDILPGVLLTVPGRAIA
ncbi:hypothetical protein MB901379_02894 [Mycobacterium basiliense]|uniref:Uncharacterized protein n=1 Tax=Mycobacterium basiliense TaxID=2094119 RepID=A0A3S4BX15_9MYCO|nr:hypothetical protein MB901379_02894 [Mycobacterium basiliense]